MSHENPDKNIHWRDRLEGLDYLPGKSLDKDTAWDKLYGRLRGEQRHKKFAWYWIAAACSAIVLIVALVMNRSTKRPDVANIQPAVKQTQKINTRVLRADEKNENRNDVAVTTPKYENAATSHKSVEAKHRMKAVDVANKVVPANIVNSILENPTVIQPLTIANNNSTVVQAPPSKKKLSVVHINELGDPVIEDPDVVRNIDKHKLKFGTGEVYANSPTGYNAKEYNVLTAKL
jgi:hypothetical protein